MKILNLLLIALLLVFLGIGAYTIYTLTKFYTNDFIPHKVLIQHVYPYELFEAICLAATIFCVLKFRKAQYNTSVNVAFAVVILSSLFLTII